MRVKKTKVADLDMSYAVGFFQCGGKLKGIAASEGEAECILFDPEHPEKQETVWEHAGGTMSIAQIEEDGTFLAVQNFFKGFNSRTAHIVRASPGEGGWKVEPYLELPFVHRFDVIRVEDRQFLLAGTLCDDKDFKEDWSRPGRVWLGELPPGAVGTCELTPLISGITKNHGFWRGNHEGREVVLISGMEGLFEISVPRKRDGKWEYVKLIEKEISDAVIVDIDGDGVEEIVTIEGFHGNRIVIYKPGWNAVYSCPVAFGHVVWGGSILGKPSLIIGYREDNAALLLLRKKPGEGFYMEHFVIDEHEGPTNISVNSGQDRCMILCSCGKTKQVVLYELTEG